MMPGNVMGKLKRGLNKIQRVFVGSDADKQYDEQAKKQIREIKKDADNFSKYRDEVADYYADLVDFLKKLCEYDRKNFNIAAITKAMKGEDSKKGEIDPHTKKEACSVSKSLYDEHVRKINIKSVKVIRDKDGKEKASSTVAIMPTKVNFRNYFDMNGKPSKELSYTYDFLRGMDSDVAVRKTVKLHAVCCIYMERMEQKIRLFFTNHKKFKQLQAYYKRLEEKLVKLTNQERRIIKGFSKNVYNELTGESKVETLPIVKNKEENRDDRIEFGDGYSSEFLRKIQEVKDFVSEHAVIANDKRYSRACFRSINRLKSIYTGSTRRLESSFEVMAEGGKEKDPVELKKETGYTELIQKIDEAFNELEELRKEVLSKEIDLGRGLSRLDNKEKLRRYKHNIEKKIVLTERKKGETDLDYEKRSKEIDRQRAKECVDLIESLGFLRSNVEDYDLKFGRKKRYLAGLLRELGALDDTPKFKRLKKESMEGKILGRGRSIRFNHNLDKKLKSKKGEWDKKDKETEEKRKKELNAILEEGKAEAKAEEEAARQEEEREREAIRQAAEAEAKKKKEEEEAKKKATAAKPAATAGAADSGGAVPAGESSSSSSADLPEGGAPSTKPLPKRP